jgi:hypothetical protein
MAMGVRNYRCGNLIQQCLSSEQSCSDPLGRGMTWQEGGGVLCHRPKGRGRCDTLGCVSGCCVRNILGWCCVRLTLLFAL